MRTLALFAFLACGLAAAPKQPRVTLEMNRVPIGELIHYVCSAAQASYRIDNNSVIISRRRQNANAASTRFFQTSARFLSTLPAKGGAAALQEHFENMGISFGPGAKVAYVPRKSLLVVTNTSPQFRKFEQLLDQLDAGGWQYASEDPVYKKLRQIVVSAKFENASLAEVARYLHKRSRELDPEGKGINIYYVP
jgi:hypothetical protein